MPQSMSENAAVLSDMICCGFLNILRLVNSN